MSIYLTEYNLDPVCAHICTYRQPASTQCNVNPVGVYIVLIVNLPPPSVMLIQCVPTYVLIVNLPPPSVMLIQCVPTYVLIVNLPPPSVMLIQCVPTLSYYQPYFSCSMVMVDASYPGQASSI